MADIFSRLNAGRPPTKEPAPPPGPLATPPEALRLLNWIQRNCSQPILRARDVYRRGPRAVRDRKNALEAAEALTERGWLTPLETRRHDMRQWRIMRGF